MAFSSETRRASFSVRDGSAVDGLSTELAREKLKRAIRDAKSDTGTSSGSGSGSGSGMTPDQREAANRDYQTSENAKAFDRQRQLAADRAGMDSAAKADETANLIRLRREASTRGLGVRRALSRSSRG